MKDDTDIVALRQPGSVNDPLTEIARDGARRMFAAALRAEADAFVEHDAEEALPDGRQRIVRHGYGPERNIQTGIGPLDVRRPKIRSRATDMPAAKTDRFTRPCVMAAMSLLTFMPARCWTKKSFVISSTAPQETSPVACTSSPTDCFSQRTWSGFGYVYRYHQLANLRRSISLARIRIAPWHSIASVMRSAPAPVSAIRNCDRVLVFPSRILHSLGARQPTAIRRILRYFRLLQAPRR